MVVRPVPAFPAVGSRGVFAELDSVRVDARIDLQRVDAAGGATARGVGVDVAAADGLLFPAASRRRGQRRFPDGVCAGDDGLRAESATKRGMRNAECGKNFGTWNLELGTWTVNSLRFPVDRREGEQSPAAPAVGNCCGANTVAMVVASFVRS